jgi:hypothetical protein
MILKASLKTFSLILNKLLRGLRTVLVLDFATEVLVRAMDLDLVSVLGSGLGVLNLDLEWDLALGLGLVLDSVLDLGLK